MSKRKKKEQKISKVQRKQPAIKKHAQPERKQQRTEKKRQPNRHPAKGEHESPLSYNESQRILCVGEGNFSFARALVRTTQGQGQLLTATAYDTKDTVLEKYEDGSDPVSEILEELQECDATVCFAVDATDIAKSLQAACKRQHVQNTPQAFDRIIFNFPHIGLGIKDQDVNVRKNQQMLSSFFFSACEVLNLDGELCVTLKEGKPYSLWNIVSLAHHSTHGMLVLKTTCAFHPSQYPGYTHRRTLGFKQGASKEDNEEIQGSNKTYVFRLQS